MNDRSARRCRGAGGRFLSWTVRFAAWGQLAACLVAPNAHGGETMNLDSLLPREVLGWSTPKEAREYGRGNLFDYMNGAGEVYLAYDFRRLLVREYAKTSAPRIVAEVYEMSSSEDAFGIFCHDPDGKPVELGQGAVYALGLLRSENQADSGGLERKCLHLTPREHRARHDSRHEIARWKCRGGALHRLVRRTVATGV